MKFLIRMMALFALLSVPAVAQTIDFTTIETNVSGYATFNSNTQKIARNKNGTVLTYQQDSNYPTYTSQTNRFVWIKPDSTRVTLFTETYFTNPPCVMASDTGEFFAVFPDQAASTLRLYIWRDINTNPLPSVYTTAFAAAPAEGKFTCAFDEQRRTVYFVGLAGTFFKARVDGVTFSSVQLWTNGANPAQYPSLNIGKEGAIHLFWNTITGGSPTPQYRTIQYMVSPNDGLNWYFMWHPKVSVPSSLTLPIDPTENGLSAVLSRGEDTNANTYLLSAFGDTNKISAAWSFTPNSGERCFIELNRCTSVFMQYSRLDNLRSLQQAPIATGQKVIRTTGGGGIVRRVDKTYFVTMDKTDLVLLEMAGDGAKEVQRAAIPGASASRCAYSLGAAFGSDADTDIIGTFTLLNVSCYDWATASTLPRGDIIHFRIALRGEHHVRPEDCRPARRAQQAWL